MSKTITTTRETTWDVSSAATFTDTFTLSNLGPLTTTFTPAADCLTTWYAMSNHLELGVPSRTDCFPPGFTPGGFSTSRYFSPGLCPSLYTGAKSLDLWWTASGNSGVHCCPMYIPCISLADQFVLLRLAHAVAILFPPQSPGVVSPAISRPSSPSSRMGLSCAPRSSRRYGRRRFP